MFHTKHLFLLCKFVFHDVYVMRHIWGSDPVNNKKCCMIILSMAITMHKELKYRYKQP